MGEFDYMLWLINKKYIREIGLEWILLLASIARADNI